MKYREILEACWKGYHKEGMKTMFGKRYPNCVKNTNEELEEDLRKWFKEKWVRFGPDGKIRGDCARGDDSEGKPKCLPQSKAQNLGKKGRASAASRKRRQDPNPERSGKAINVNTKKKSNEGVAEGSSGMFSKVMGHETSSEAAQQILQQGFKKSRTGIFFNVDGQNYSGGGYGGTVVMAKVSGPIDDILNLEDDNDLPDDLDDFADGEEIANYARSEGYWAWTDGVQFAVLDPRHIQVVKPGVAEAQLDEKWSTKYKDSINCANPKGFSQRAHCAGKKKNESVTEATGYIPVNDKEARDPRYSMAITQDIRPGEVQRQAAKMGFTTDAAGVPPLLMKLQNQLKEIKTGVSR
jgi:hypothetical protein